MKTLLLFGMIMLPAICFSQTVDTAAVILEVDSLIQVSRGLTGTGDFEKALEVNAVAEKLTLEKLGKETASYGSTCFNHGRVFHIQRNYPDAEKWYLECNNVREKVLGKEHADYANILNSLGVLYFEMGRFEDAEPLYHEAIAIREKVLGKEHSDYASSLNNLANLFSYMGQYEAAEPLYLESKSIREKVLGKEHPDYAWSMTNLAVLYEQMGRYEAAEPLYLEAKAIRGKVLGKEHRDYASSLNDLAILYYEMGRYEAAESLYLEAKAIWEKVLGKVHPVYARNLSNLATLYSKMGRYEAAEPLFLEAKAIREKVLGKEHPDYASSLNNLAALYDEMGRYGAAESLYLEAKAIWERVLGKEHPVYTNSLNNLAVLYKNLGRYEASESLYVEAKAIQEKAIGKEHPDYAISLNNLAILYEDIGRYEAAEHLYLEAKAIREKVLGKEHPEYASSLNSLANLYSEMGRYEAAEPFYLEAKSIREKVLGKEHPDYASSLFNLASLYFGMDRNEAAEPLLLESNTIQRNLTTKSSQYLSERELSAYDRLFVRNLDQYFSFSQTNPATSPELSGGCYDNALFHKGFLLTASQQLKHLAESHTASSKQFEILLSYQRRLAQEYTRVIDERENVAELEEKANTLEKALARSVPGYKEALRQVTWQEVREKLKPGEVAIEFIQYQFYNPKPCDSIYYTALVLLPGDKAPLFIPMFEEREIAPLLEGAKGRNINGINALYSSGGQKPLYDLIWKPLEGFLQGAATVYCSPSGLLHRLNLGAIPSDKGQAFSERHKLVLLGSTRQLVVPNTFKSSGNSAYVAGGIRYDWDSSNVPTGSTEPKTRGLATPNELPFNIDSTARGGTWDYLPNSTTEALEISKILKAQKFSVQLDTGHFATEESFKRLGSEQPSPRTILLATHGFFFPDPKSEVRPGEMGAAQSEPVFKTSNDPLIRSGLLLAGAQQTWTTGKGLENREDGILTAYEISKMNLSGTELVVLSACETGLGDIQGNEGVYGLQRAFKIAGAKYLIMSLWEVNDKSTSEFMTEFYRQWLKLGLSIPEAFRATQRGMQVKYKDGPYYWAGFVLVE